MALLFYMTFEKKKRCCQLVSQFDSTFFMEISETFKVKILILLHLHKMLCESDLQELHRRTEQEGTAKPA